MRKEQSKLAGFAHLLRPDPKRVEADAAWNGHLDTICEAVQGLKVEQDSNEPLTLTPDEPEPEEKPKRKAKSKPNRMHEGGEDRDDAA
jgi:hypothetical protein